MKHTSWPSRTLLIVGTIFISAFYSINSHGVKTIKAAANTTVQFDTVSAARATGLPNYEARAHTAVDRNNVAHIVFIYPVNTNLYDLMYTNNSSGSFSTPVTIEYVASVTETPFITYANDALHLYYTNDQKKAIYRTGTLNGTWGPPIIINIAANRSDNGGMAVESNGTIHFSYIEDKCNGLYSVYYKKMVGGVLSPESNPFTSTPCIYRAAPRITVVNGTPHLLYRSNKDIFYTRLLPSGWTPETNVSNSPITTSFNPAIATNGTNIYIAWSDGEIYFRYSLNNGQTWSNQAILTNPDPLIATFPFITWVTSVNKGYIFWGDQSGGVGGKTDIKFVEFDPIPTDFTGVKNLTCLPLDSNEPIVGVGPSKTSLVWTDRYPNGDTHVYYMGGQIGTGLTTTSCSSAPANEPTITVTVSSPTPTRVPTRTPTPSPTPFQIPTPDAATLKRLSLRSGNEPSECFGVEWVAFYTLASVLIIMAIHFAIHIRKEFNIWGMAFYFAFGGVITWYIHSCDFSFVGLIIGFILSFLFY